MYRLCEEFFHHRADLKSINYSYITLLPKKDNLENVNDFRPISLVNSTPKLVSKLMANRLQSVILEVHNNQYGFVMGRTIQDCLSWAFEYLHQCHHSKREIVVLKLDFEKAFDVIEHSLVLEMLKAKCFLDRRLHWVEDLFSTAVSSVLLNGIAGKDF
jgi:retron-type reverse transcriptase